MSDRNDVTIHVRAEDDGTAAVFKKVKEDAKRGGAAAGDEFSGSFSGQLMAQKAAMGKSGETLGKEITKGAEKSTKAAKPLLLPATAENPIDAAWRQQVETSLKATAKNALKIPITPESEAFQRELSRLLDQASHTAKADIPMDVKDAAEFKRQVEFLADSLSKEVSVRVPVEVDKQQLKKMSDDVDSETSKVARRANAQFDAMKFTALSVGLPAAALVGATATGAALSLVPVAFAAMAVAGLASSDKLADRVAKLRTTVQDDTEKMAQPLESTFVEATDKATASFKRMEPQIQAAMIGSKDSVLTLTDGVTKLAENALPGMVNMVKNSGAALNGMESLMSDVGAGAGDMFTAMSKGSEGAGAGMKVTGGIIRDLEGFTGQLFTNLANGSSGPLKQFQGTLHGVEDTALSLTSNGMPALQGTTSGFLNIVSGGVGILKMGADALGSWAQPLGAMGGSMLATNSVAKLFGTSLGETGFGLRAFATSTDEAGKKTSPFRTALADTEAGGTKLTRGLKSVADNGLNPMGLAILAGGFLLDKLGESQQKAAAAAAEHRENVRSLTDALRQDGGVIGDNTKQVNAKALADANAASNLRVFGQSTGVATAAIEGNRQAYDKIQYSADAALTTIAKAAGATDDQAKVFGQLGKTSLETGKNFEDLQGDMNALLTTSDSTGDATIILTQAQRDQANAILNGTGAVGEQVKAQRDAHDAYVLSESVLNNLTTAQVQNRDATNAATTAMYEQQNQQLGYRGAVLNTGDAIAAYQKVLDDGKSSVADKEKAILAVERAFAAQEQAAYNAAYANSTSATEDAKKTDGLRAMDAETVKLANSMGNNLPASIQQTISKMSVAQAQAAGMTVAIDDAGNAVYRLPNGKQVVISAETGQAKAAIEEVNRLQAALHDKEVTNTIVNRVVNLQTSGGAYQPSLTGRRTYGADGGQVGGLPVKQFAEGGAIDGTRGGQFRGAGTGRSDDLLVRASTREFIVNEKDTEENLGLLHLINDGKIKSFADGGMAGTYGGWTNPSAGGSFAPAPQSGTGSAGGSGGKVVIDSSGSRLDDLLLEILRISIRNQGGDVQLVLGSR